MKLERYNFIFTLNDDENQLTITGVRTPNSFFFIWIVLPLISMIIFFATGIFLALYSSIGFITYFTTLLVAAFASYLIVGFRIVNNRTKFNRKVITIKPAEISIGEVKFKVSNFETIDIAGHSTYERNNTEYLKYDNLMIESNNGFRYNFLYIFGDNERHLREDLLYLRKHFLEILNSPPK